MRGVFRLTTVLLLAALAGCMNPRQSKPYRMVNPGTEDSLLPVQDHTSRQQGGSGPGLFPPHRPLP